MKNIKDKYISLKYKKKYLNKKKEKGTFYAYILPAIKRASQALGRALRSKEDNALFILGDKRYINFIRYLPDFIQKNLKIISNSNDMIKEIKNFKNI
jgi:DNA excision repair protein ERCC-2